MRAAQLAELGAPPEVVVVDGGGATPAGGRGASTNGEGASGRGPGPSIGSPPTGGDCGPGFTDGGSGGSGPCVLHDTAHGVAATSTPTTTRIARIANLCAIVSVIWTPKEKNQLHSDRPTPVTGFSRVAQYSFQLPAPCSYGTCQSRCAPCSRQVVRYVCEYGLREASVSLRTGRQG